MFFHLVVATSATDLSSHLGRLPDRNLVTALHWDLVAVLLGNLLTVLNRFLDWDLIREWWYWWRRCRCWDSPVNKILLGLVHTGSRASELGFADSSVRELSYIAFHIHRIHHGQKNKPRNIKQLIVGIFGLLNYKPLCKWLNTSPHRKSRNWWSIAPRNW